MFFTKEALSEIETVRSEWIEREKNIEEIFLFRQYLNKDSNILVRHGLVRRLNTLVHCIDNIFKTIPLKLSNINRGSIHDAEIFLQAFIINIYGAIDNLARLWVWESNLTKADGKALPQSKIGLGPRAEIIRGSLSETMQIHLRSMDEWFMYLENYRHALAHRIPVYIPPKTLNTAEMAEWNRLEKELSLARNAKDFSKTEILSNAQGRLGRFEPWMMHSYGDKETDAVPIQFHAQLICDLATIVVLSEKMADELDHLQETS